MKIIVGTVVEQDGKYLLVQEAQEKCRGKWNLPAGHWDEGETLFDGAIRETLEETGYKVELTGLIGINQFPDAAGLAIIFAGKIIGGEINFSKDDILDVEWVDYSELDEMDLRTEFVKESIKDLRDGKVYPLEIVKEK